MTAGRYEFGQNRSFLVKMVKNDVISTLRTTVTKKSIIINICIYGVLNQNINLPRPTHTNIGLLFKNFIAISTVKQLMLIHKNILINDLSCFVVFLLQKMPRSRHKIKAKNIFY